MRLSSYRYISRSFASSPKASDGPAKEIWPVRKTSTRRAIFKTSRTFCLFQERIAEPCGMTNTHFVSGELGGGARSNLRDDANFLPMTVNGGVFDGKQVLSAAAMREMQADQLRGAFVKQAEFPQRARGARSGAIYGLGGRREELDANGNATLTGGPSWAGVYPWIDKNNSVYGVFIAHIGGPGVERDNFSGSRASLMFARMVRNVVVPRGDVGDPKRPRPFPYSVPEEKRVRVIISSDAANEVDDQYAIVHALLTPQFIIKGKRTQEINSAGKLSAPFQDLWKGSESFRAAGRGQFYVSASGFKESLAFCTDAKR